MTIALQVNQTRAEGLLGASDAACALGLDPYRAPISLWRQLRGLETEERERPAFVQEAAEWGQILEPVVRGKYALATGRAVYVPSESSTRDGWLRCTPDGFVMATTEDRPPGTYHHDPVEVPLGLLQCKTASAYKRDEWEAGVPSGYEIQCRVEMAVCDLPWNDIVCLVGGQKFYGPIRIERDMDIEGRILTDLRRFWDSTKTGEEPPVDASADWRAYASSKMRPSKVVITPDDEMRELVTFAMAQRRKAKMAKEEGDAAKTDILVRLSAAGATGIDLGADRKVTAYQTGAKAAWKAYALSLGGSAKIPDQYKGAPGTWALRFPGDEDEE